MSLRDAFFGATLDEKVMEGPVGKVLVRSLTIGGKDRIQSAVMVGGNYRTVVMRECLFDPETGEPVFGKGDDPGKVNAKAVEPYINCALQLSAFTTEEREEIEGNSERTPSSGTASD